MIQLPTYIKIFGARILYIAAKGFLLLQGKTADKQLVKRNGILYELELNEGIDLSIYLFGSFEKDTTAILQKLIKAGDTVLDIGANVGAHSLTMAKAVGEHGRVIAIEATDWAIEKLLKNAELNPTINKRILALQCLLTHDVHAETPIELYSSWNLKKISDQHAVHKGSLKTTKNARVVRLDTILSELQIRQVDVVKIDVDGFEYWVLLGAEQMLEEQSPTLLIELSPYVHQEHGSSFEELLGFLYSKNYRFYRIEDGALLPKDIEELTRLIPKNGGINAIGRRRKEESQT